MGPPSAPKKHLTCHKQTNTKTRQPPSGVTVFSDRPLRGYIGGNHHQCKPDRYFVPFSQIESVWKFAVADKFLLLGDVPVQRDCGWNTGDAISAEGTAVDLRESERQLFKSKTKFHTTIFRYNTISNGW